MRSSILRVRNLKAMQDTGLDFFSMIPYLAKLSSSDPGFEIL